MVECNVLEKMFLNDLYIVDSDTAVKWMLVVQVIAGLNNDWAVPADYC
jgi:hypothetical protein